MKLFLNTKQLQFLDIVLKTLARGAGIEKAPKLLFKTTNIVMSGDLFIYKNGKPCFKELDCFGAIEESYWTTVPNIHSYLYEPLNAAFGKISPEKLNTLITNLDILSTFLFSDKYLELISNINIPFEPFVYSPKFFNIDMPSLSFYILDATKHYDIISIISSDE